MIVKRQIYQKFNLDYQNSVKIQIIKCCYVFTECAAGYYASGTNCSLCIGNTIKPSQGDASQCDTECDPGSEPNDVHTACGTQHLSVHTHCILVFHDLF